MPNTIKPKKDVVTVGSTSKTLATLLGASLRGSTKTVLLRPHASGIYISDGTATANDDPMGMDPLQFDGGADNLDELQFYAATNTKMTVWQTG